MKYNYIGIRKMKKLASEFIPPQYHPLYYYTRGYGDEWLDCVYFEGTFKLSLYLTDKGETLVVSAFAWNEDGSYWKLLDSSDSFKVCECEVCYE